jgi:hypothetical protein
VTMRLTGTCIMGLDSHTYPFRPVHLVQDIWDSNDAIVPTMLDS